MPTARNQGKVLANPRYTSAARQYPYIASQNTSIGISHVFGVFGISFILTAFFIIVSLFVYIINFISKNNLIIKKDQELNVKDHSP